MICHIKKIKREMKVHLDKELVESVFALIVRDAHGLLTLATNRINLNVRVRGRRFNLMTG